MEREFDKHFYRIRDVAEILSVPASTLRYWESVFSELRPRRNNGGKRLYSASDIELLHLIRFLLYEKGLTIEGAQEQIKHNRQGVSRIQSAIARLQAMRSRLSNIVDALDSRQRQLRDNRIKGIDSK